MERESFESENIGSLLNENFVSIKVDREERPDVDRVYMTFIQVGLSLSLQHCSLGMEHHLLNNWLLLILTAGNRKPAIDCVPECAWLQVAMTSLANSNDVT